MKNNKDYLVNINNVKTDFTVLENIDLFKCELPPKVYPEHPNYMEYWTKEFARIIEGIWRPQFDGYRYMPPCLYFYANWFILTHTIEEDGLRITKPIKPILADYFWDLAYMTTACYGFSGFEKDDTYSCNQSIKLYYKGIIKKEQLDKHCISKNGEVKEYVKPFEYLKKLHDKPLGRGLYSNQNSNFSIMGSRGGGKSFFIAALLEHNHLTAGTKSYNQFRFSNPKIDQVVGSSDASRSSDLLAKMKFSMDAKANSENTDFVNWFGVWGEEGEKDFTPSPFYVRNLGNLNCPNKAPRKVFRSSYKIKKNGQWIEKGNQCNIYHLNYSEKKGDGAEAAAGGRYYLSVVEEKGLVKNVIAVHNSNEGATSRNGVRDGTNAYLGTSGNIDYVTGARKMFLNPSDYNIMSFVNQNGNEGKKNEKGEPCIGFFLPFYMTIFSYKDKNGNTNYEEAINEVNRQREAKENADDPSVLRKFLMNKPCYTHEMWINNTGYYLPYEEASLRKRELMEGNLYKRLMNPVELTWNKDGGVNYELKYDVEPITDLIQDSKKLKDPSGIPVIYEFPPNDFPDDLYQFIGHDPYVEEDITRGGSLGVTYILKNPKYISNGYTGNIIVASYIGKPIKGLDYYYDQQEKLIALYGNPKHGLWYEGNAGTKCREHYIRKRKQEILCLTPQRNQGKSVYQRNIISNGFIVGARGSVGKKNLVKLTRDWLLEETELPVEGEHETETKKNIFRIPCLFLINQIEAFNLDENFDGVSAFLGCILGLREYQNIEETTTLNVKEQKDKLAIYFANRQKIRYGKYKK